VEQKKVIDAIRSKGLGERVRVMIGGAAVDRKWAEEIGADGYGADGTDAVRNAKMLFKS
jgi:methanogenic corrinoid protein MtbC1